MKIKVFAVLQLMILFLAGAVWAEIPVNFYATVSESQDTNMLTMTTDLFYTQIQSIDGYSVIDKRKLPYDPAETEQTGVVFYAEIQEGTDGLWSCTLNAIDTSTRKTVSETKSYDSYYKILLDAKASLVSVLTNLNASAEGLVKADGAKESAPQSSKAQSSVKLDSLAGTWTGEKLVDKIIIMRGGRGFVIYKNGASMNVQVSVEGATVSVRQTGRSNASFFPELPRELALKNASGASPITWSLSQTDENTLEGTKNTLLEDHESDSGTKNGSVEVKWTKQ